MKTKLWIGIAVLVVAGLWVASWRVGKTARNQTSQVRGVGGVANGSRAGGESSLPSPRATPELALSRAVSANSVPVGETAAVNGRAGTAVHTPRSWVPAGAAGQSAVATVSVGDRAEELIANEVGDFPRVNVAPRQTVPVRLVYPQAEPGAPIVVQVMDGGAMASPERPAGINHDLVRLLRLDQARSAEMSFTVSEHGGMHRLVLTQGADKKVLDFWVVTNN